jgi:hypothetical protein
MLGMKLQFNHDDFLSIYPENMEYNMSEQMVIPATRSKPDIS